jgi:hypothetical protein
VGNKSKKIPAQAQTDRANQKTVKVPRNTSIDDMPSWRFSTVDKNGPYPWPKNTAEELLILQKLHDFDSMTWSNIAGSDHHAIEINRLSRSAQNRLTELELDDIDEIFSFHFSGKKRIIGIRDRNILKLLWWDTEHQVCPSVKKHT